MEMPKEDKVLPEGTNNIPNYSVRSTIVTLFCFLLSPICLPLGVAALIYSNKVDMMLKSGDSASACQASKTAQMLVKLCWVCIIITGCLAFFLLFYLIGHSDI